MSILSLNIKVSSPLLFERQCSTMFDNRRSKTIRCTHEYYRNCWTLSILSLNKKAQSPLFFRTTMVNNRICKIICCTHEYYRNCRTLSLLSLNTKSIKLLVFLNDNVRQCLTIGYARLYVAHIIYKIVNHCQYCR